jgi:hypothetical protein
MCLPQGNKGGPSRSPGFLAGSHHAFITRTCHSNFSGPLLYYEGEGSETVHDLLKALVNQYCIAKEAVSVEFSRIEASIQEGGTLGSDDFFDRIHRSTL